VRQLNLLYLTYLGTLLYKNQLSFIRMTIRMQISMKFYNTNSLGQNELNKTGFDWKIPLAGLGIGISLAAVVLLFASTIRGLVYALLPESERAYSDTIVDAGSLEQEVTNLEQGVAKLKSKLEQMMPREPYVIVNRWENKLYLMSGKEMLREAVCSTGSYILLKDSRDERQWLFSTPRGMFRVINKLTTPIWHKPDWAFVEDGEPIPPENSPARYERGVLGEYGLAFGNGYLIHGTLYQRMLGMPVTHGCIRVGDEDLRVVYKNLRVGSKIFIY
jgi:L,D-transpeptidase ErfK/SrfK